MYKTGKIELANDLSTTASEQLIFVVIFFILFSGMVVTDFNNIRIEL